MARPAQHQRQSPPTQALRAEPVGRPPGAAESLQRKHALAGAGDALWEDDCAVLRDLVNPTYLQHDSIRWVLRAAPPCAALRCSKQPAPPQRSTACMQRMR